MRLSRKSFPVRLATALSVFLVLTLGTADSTAANVGQSMGGSKFVEVDGIRTRYFEGGSGEPMDGPALSSSTGDTPGTDEAQLSQPVAASITEAPPQVKHRTHSPFQ